MKYIYEVHGRNHDQIFIFDLEFEVEFSTFSSKVVLPTKATKLKLWNLEYLVLLSYVQKVT